MHRTAETTVETGLSPEYFRQRAVNQEICRQRFDVVALVALDDPQRLTVKQVFHDPQQCVVLVLGDGAQPLRQNLTVTTV